MTTYHDTPDWISEEGITTLRKGYLLKDETPNQMYRRLAKGGVKQLREAGLKAKVFSENLNKVVTISTQGIESVFIDAIEEDLYTILSNGWFSPASPVASNFNVPEDYRDEVNGELLSRGLPVSCLASGTKVHTLDGYRYIENLQIGDKVLTHLGNYKSISMIKSRQSNGDLYCLKVYGRSTDPLYITGNHPVLTDRGWVRVDHLTKDDKIYVTPVTNLFRPIKKIKKFCLDTVSENRNKKLVATNKSYQLHKPLKRVKSWDNRLAKIIGLWMAEGHSNKRTIGITMSVEEENIVQEWLNLVEEVFGVKGKLDIVYDKKRGSQWCNGRVNSLILCEWFEKQFGINCLTKTFPDWIFLQDDYYLSILLDSFIQGDGYLNKHGLHDVGLRNDKLVYQLYYIGSILNRTQCLGKGINSYYKKVYGEDVEDFSVYFSSNPKNRYPNKIRSIEKLDYNTKVWDITVEEDHSFIAQGVVVHNCFGSAPSNSIDGIFQTNHEIAMMSKMGGGTSVSLDNLIGISPVTHWAKVYDTTADVVSQGQTRRGSVAQYVSIEHRDIDLILDAIDKTRGDQTQKLKCNLGVTISDSFMNKLLSGDKESGRLFAKVLKLRLQTGSPYIVFIDTANRERPDDYKRLGMMILASNLCCLSGSTFVLTKEFGGVEIKDLIGKTVTIFDGQKWVKNSNWYKTEDKLKSYRVTLASGNYIDCTYNHLHWVYKDHLNIGLKDCVSLKTEDLKVGQWLVHCDKLVSDYDKIISIVPIEDDYGYCTTVPTTHSFELANKVLTHNSEIFQPSDPLHSFTCVLSSLNIDKFDEWESWYGPKSGFTVIELATIFLDGVCQEFIDKAKSISGFENAVRSAEKGRALGLGLMGLHSYYQSKMWTFDSEQALEANILISSKMKKESESASKWLAQKLGAPEWTEGGSNHRNIVKLAIAPTLTNSVICNAGSAGVDPIHSNYYVYSGAKGTFVRKNKYLVKVLENLGMNKDSTWQNIQQNNGSVQELNLPEKIKDVFKTAHEIDQSYVIQQAADRQPNIDQGQSVNLYISHDEKAPVIAKLHIQAWKKGLKSLYYIRSNNKLNNQRPVTLKEEKPQWVINYREDCPWCHKAKSLLNYFGFNPTMIIQETGQVPQIYKNGELIGGYTELFELYKDILESPNQVHNEMANNDIQGHLGGLSTMSDPDCEACEG